MLGTQVGTAPKAMRALVGAEKGMEWCLWRVTDWP